MRRSRASKKKLHVKAAIKDSYQRYQNFDALVIRLLNYAYVHVNEKTKKKFLITIVKLENI